MDLVTTPPLEDFLADLPTGRGVVEALREAMRSKQRVLVWGPRVGAIELAEDLLELWPSDEPVMGMNLGALWTRTRETGQESNWVPWVDVSPVELIDAVLARQPAGLLLTYLSALAAPRLSALLGGPFGFVTALSATSREQALELARGLCGEAFEKFDLLVGVTEVGTSTWISEVDQLVAGAPARLTRLASGRYVAA
jgi:hypothetical protein